MEVLPLFALRPCLAFALGRLVALLVLLLLGVFERLAHFYRRWRRWPRRRRRRWFRRLSRRRCRCLRRALLVLFLLRYTVREGENCGFDL